LSRVHTPEGEFHFLAVLTDEAQFQTVEGKNAQIANAKFSIFNRTQVADFAIAARLDLFATSF
jgi:hypothetical protein